MYEVESILGRVFPSLKGGIVQIERKRIIGHARTSLSARLERLASYVCMYLKNGRRTECHCIVASSSWCRSQQTDSWIVWPISSLHRFAMLRQHNGLLYLVLRWPVPLVAKLKSPGHAVPYVRQIFPNRSYIHDEICSFLTSKERRSSEIIFIILPYTRFDEFIDTTFLKYDNKPVCRIIGRYKLS